MDRENLIAALLRLANTPGDAHRRALLAGASADDHAPPVAREWLRRWGPSRRVLAVPACACDAGRCAVCN